MACSVYDAACEECWLVSKAADRPANPDPTVNWKSFLNAGQDQTRVAWRRRRRAADSSAATAQDVLLLRVPAQAQRTMGGERS